MSSIRRCVGVRSILLILAIFASVDSNAAAELQYPLSIAVAKSGTIYLADRDLPGVWKLEGGVLSVFFEGSKKFRTPLNAVRCVAVDREGKIWAGDSSTRDIYRLDDRGQATGLTQKQRSALRAIKTPSTIESVAPKPNEQKGAANKTSDESNNKSEPAPTAPPAKNTAAAPKAQFVFGEIGIPMDMAFDKSGAIFVSDLEIHRIVKVAADDGKVQEFVQIPAPRGLCFDTRDNLWVISGRRLVKVSPKGEKTTIVDDGVFEFPHTVAVAPDQSAYVCDGYAKAIWKIPAGGKPEKFVSGEPLVNPVGMRLVDDKLFVVDPRAKAVFQITFDKRITPVTLKASRS